MATTAFAARGQDLALAQRAGDGDRAAQRELFALLRLAVTGRTAAPGLFQTMHICGKDRTRRRIREAIATLERGESW